VSVAGVRAMRLGAVAVRVNPVLRREVVERMRGRRAAVLVTVYLTLLSFSLYVAYQGGRGAQALADPFGRPSLNSSATVGRGIFEWLLFVMLLLVLFFVPAQGAGAIAGERERQTLVPLQVTLLRPLSIILGKIGAALAFLMLLIMSTLPLLAVCYLIGGVTIGEVVGGVALVLYVGVPAACISAACSALVRRVQAATVLAYGAVLGMLLGTLAAGAAWEAIDASRGADRADSPSWLLLPNPLALVADVVDDGSDGYSEMSSPLDWLEDRLQESDSGAVVGFDGVVMDDVPIDEFGDPIVGSEKSSFWWQSMLVLGAAAALAVAAGSLRLRTPARSER
jgi:hypothetical protein